MSSFRVSQVRSGEGWILTSPSTIGAEVLAGDLSDLVPSVLLVASDEFESWTPPGGEQLEAHLYAFTGEAARAMLRDWRRWGSRRAIAAALPSLPDADAKRRWIPDALRPWDPERLKATAYAQLGRDWAQQGLWFAREEDRRRFVEKAVERLLAERGVRRPNGDVTLVLEMPTDSTFEADFAVSGSGETLKLRREFPSRLASREWLVRNGEWEATERRVAASVGHDLKRRLTQALATIGILLISIPVFVMVGIVAIIAKLTRSSTSASTSSARSAR